MKALQKEKAKPQAREKNPKKKVVVDENPDDSIALSTCKRLKKLLAPKMARHYKPKEVEELWYAWWESSGFFKRDYTSTKPTFVMGGAGCSINCKCHNCKSPNGRKEVT